MSVRKDDDIHMYILYFEKTCSSLNNITQSCREIQVVKVELWFCKALNGRPIISNMGQKQIPIFQNGPQETKGPKSQKKNGAKNSARKTKNDPSKLRNTKHRKIESKSVKESTGESKKRTAKQEMSTIFIAVQCFQCSTMQVKQQRKSGNKWICAVCNEKQSVQTVFARAPMAKDVRKFVQGFNMSRKCADEQMKFDEIIDGGVVDEDQLDCSPRRKRRSDWSEYLDLEEDRGESGRENERELGSDFAEAKIVTEFPEVKTRRSSSSMSRSSWSEDGEGDGLYRPVFSKRKHIAKNLSSQDEIRNSESPSAIHGSKWSKRGVSDNDETLLSKRKHIAKHLSSKDEIRNSESPSAIHESKWSKGGISDDDEIVLSKRKHIAKHLSSKDEIRNSESPSAIHESKWSKDDDEIVLSKRKHMAKDGIRNWDSASEIEASKWGKDDGNARTKTCILAKVRRGASKWSEYITEEDNCGDRNGENQGMDLLKMTMVNDEMVEDDSYPDFK